MESELLSILIIVGVGYWTGAVAKKKGYDFWVALFLGMLLPIIVLIIYALLPVSRDKETGEILPQKKTNPWVIGIVMLFFLSVFGRVLGDSPSSSENTHNHSGATNEVAQSQESIITATAYGLWQTYTDNGVRADQQLKNKTLEISGTISDIQRDILDTAYITLETGNEFQPVQCMFDSSQENILANVTKGQRVVIIGTCSGATFTGGVLITHCYLK